MVHRNFHTGNLRAMVPDNKKELSATIGKGTHSAMSFNNMHQMHILIIDGYSQETSAIKAMLTENGFNQVSTVINPGQAAEFIIKNNAVMGVDLILLDITTEDADDYRICHALHARKICTDIPVIIILNNLPLQYNPLAFSLNGGATDLIVKPLHSAELMPRIVSALTLKQERDLRKSRENALETELAERKVIEARLQYLVGHDDLTGLCNRRRLEQELELTILHTRYSNNTSALLYLDLDQFKIINDTEGHAAGDRLLISVANKFRRQIGAAGVLARISSDEYAILIEDTDLNNVVRTAESLRILMDEFRFKTENRTYHIGVSIGIAMIRPNENLSAAETLTHADQACYVAKNRGRNMVHVFNREDVEMLPLRRAVHWVPLIRDALTNKRFCLVFQPVLNIKKQQTTHYEALIRIQGDNRELTAPTNFIPVAERTGLIHEIDLWVAKEAIMTLKTLPTHLSINVNLSSYAFQNPALLHLLSREIFSTGVKASRIVFEITETAAIANFSETRKMITEIRALGFQFALDDFGAGFNSFSYLKELPVDYLKIDGSFIINLLHDRVDQTLVKSMIEVARTLGKYTVAEFVENQETLELLQEYGVDYAQGYYIGKPEKLALSTTTCA